MPVKQKKIDKDNKKISDDFIKLMHLNRVQL